MISTFANSRIIKHGSKVKHKQKTSEELKLQIVCLTNVSACRHQAKIGGETCSMHFLNQLILFFLT
jgi:hypothetical protein